MISLKTKNQGFTIIELLIVIIVIGILATLVITTFSGIQRNARNRTREADINALHSQLEYFYGQQGHYPAMVDLNNATWREGNMQGLDAGALSDPQNEGSQAVAAVAVTGSAYGYATEDCDDAGDECENYVLTANYEGDGTFTKNSLN